jgi:hypothetical protein
MDCTEKERISRGYTDIKVMGIYRQHVEIMSPLSVFKNMKIKLKKKQF